jgi:hypothetical protein
MPRIAMQTAMRAAAVQLLSDYNADLDTPNHLQIYPARPRSIKPPTAFVDSLREDLEYTASLVQRTPTADVIVIHGMFDSLSAANQRDAFVDGFLDWAIDNYHAAGANTLVAVTSIDDIPDYVPDWLPPEEQRTYYATRISLEGLALN